MRLALDIAQTLVVSALLRRTGRHDMQDRQSRAQRITQKTAAVQRGVGLGQQVGGAQQLHVDSSARLSHLESRDDAVCHPAAAVHRKHLRRAAALERAQYRGVDSRAHSRSRAQDLSWLLYPQVAGGGVVHASLPWMPQFGLELQLRMDGYAWVFALLVSVIGALVVFYARYYLSPADPVPRFFSFLLAFMGAMLGIVLSGNLIQMVVFWELTSFTSFMLIAYWYHRAEARRGAGMALTITAAGGLCLLAAVLLIGHVVGSYDLDRVLAAGGAGPRARMVSR